MSTQKIWHMRCLLWDAPGYLAATVTSLLTPVSDNCVLPILEHSSVGRTAVLETGPLPPQDHKSGTICRPISDYVVCHTASSGGYWRHFYLDGEATAQCELFLTAPNRNILTYLLLLFATSFRFIEITTTAYRHESIVAEHSSFWLHCLVFFAEFDAKRSRSRVFFLGVWRASSCSRQAATPVLLLLCHVNSLPERTLNRVHDQPELIPVETTPSPWASSLIGGPIVQCHRFAEPSLIVVVLSTGCLYALLCTVDIPAGICRIKLILV